MASEIYNNFDVKKASHIDNRLITVSSYANLPNSSSTVNPFLYIGALVYVEDTNEYYRLDSSLVWQKLLANSGSQGILKVRGDQSISILDLANVQPSIANCDSVLVEIQNGTSLDIHKIKNFPSGKFITFYTQNGKDITFIHKDYTAGPSDGQIVIEDGFDFILTGRLIGDENITFVRNSDVIVQQGATQFSKSTDFLQNLLSIDLEDNLTTQSSVKALTANQGVVLKGLIDNKEPTFTKGNGLTYDSNSNNLAVDPWDWVRLTPPTASNDFSTESLFQSWLTNLSSNASSNSYRYVVANNTVINYGIWLIPPSVDPTIYGNWIMLSSPDPLTSHVQYSFSVDSSPSLIGNYYHPSIDVNSVIGDEISGFNFSTSGNVNSFAFDQFGLYEIKACVSLIAVNQTAYDEISKADLCMWSTNGLQVNSDPIGSGTKAFSNSYSLVNMATQGTKTVTANISITMEINGGGNSGFAFSIAKSDGTAMTWTDISVNNNSTLTITKLR
jgi:hypothetical protein